MGRFRCAVCVGVMLQGVNALAQGQPDQPPPDSPPPESSPPPPMPPADAPPVTPPVAPPVAPPASDVNESSPPPPVETWSTSTYPQELAQRPLVLPPGAVEVAVPLAWTRTENAGTDTFNHLATKPRVRYAVSQLELEAGADLYLWQTEQDSMGGIIVFPEPERLSAIYAAVRYGITPNQFVGAELSAYNLTGDSDPRYVPVALFANKFRLSQKAGLELAIGAGLDRTRFDSGLGGADVTLMTVFGLAQFRAQAQVSPTVALEARATLRAHKDQSDNASMFAIEQGGLAMDYGLRLVAAVSPMVDAIVGVDVLQSGDLNVKAFTVGAAVRSVP